MCLHNLFYTTDIKIRSIIETADFIKKIKSSLVRFGDGEIDIINHSSIPYQPYSPELAKQLKNILETQSDEKCLVALPDVFQNLERYNNSAQNFWKGHFERYHNFYQELHKSDWYANTFISRPYIDLEDKSSAAESFEAVRSLWEAKDILIVEGTSSRSGVGNTLFQNAKSISRIICPSHNAYQKYNDILESIKTFGMEKLILLMLGPTAKVLGFQLSREGYQAIDIGHIDSEYEWYQMGASYKVKLQHKHTAEHNYDTDIIFLQDNDYENSIIGRIE